MGIEQAPRVGDGGNMSFEDRQKFIGKFYPQLPEDSEGAIQGVLRIESLLLDADGYVTPETNPDERSIDG